MGGLYEFVCLSCATRNYCVMGVTGSKALFQGGVEAYFGIIERYGIETVWRVLFKRFPLCDIVPKSNSPSHCALVAWPMCTKTAYI